jgi:hypothetical protein
MAAGRDGTRSTATFVPYFWEAYNQIVRPDRFDWYLISRWLPDLGPDGFTLLKALRNLCYFNPKEGTLRDTCQITVDELAVMCGMKRSSLYRVLEGNEALSHFVERQPEAIHIEGRTRRLPPRWRVCMDTPIHPSDMEEYDFLRAQREGERVVDPYEKRKSQIEIYEKRKSQNGISEGRKSQNGGRESQKPDRKSQSGTTYKEESLPLESIPSESSIPLRGSDPPIDSPKGEEENSPDTASVAQVISTSLADAELAQAWETTVHNLVGTGVINKPTLETHIRLLRVLSLDRATGIVEIATPSAFCWEWVGKRYLPQLQTALSEALGGYGFDSVAILCSHCRFCC